MTDNNPFAAPAAPSGFDYNDHLGRLLVIEPSKLEVNVPTTLGDRDAIRADIHVIDGPGAPDDIVDVLIFPRVLQSQLRSRLGQMVLGRLEQGVAKAGQNPPWRLAEATPADQQAAQAWLQSRPAGNPFAAPAASAQPPF